MDIVLGVSVSPETVRMVLVEGEAAGGVTVDQTDFDVPPGTAAVAAADPPHAGPLVGGVVPSATGRSAVGTVVLATDSAASGTGSRLAPAGVLRPAGRGGGLGFGRGRNSG